MQKYRKQSLFFKIVFSVFSFFISCPFIFSLSTQEKLSNLNSTWSSVLPGTALCEPALTSYGFCIATDARNIMGFSSSGDLLWEKNIGRIKNVSLTALNGDFILFHDKSKNLIKLFNPSGKEIWSKVLDFKLSQKAFDGRDGRFFLYGERTVLCLGINGIIRWKMETPLQKNLPAQELPDGSLIVFLSDKDGLSHGLRISPFGEKLENITFSGSIKTCNSCKDGILLTFTDGSAGLFSLKNGLSDSCWVASAKGSNTVFVVKSDGSDYRLLSLSDSEITVYKINSDDGNVEGSRTIKGIKGNSLFKTYFSMTGLFLADSSKAILLDNNFKEIWTAEMPDTVKNKTVNQICYLDDDYLIFCGRNWSMDAYRTSQTMKSKGIEKSSVLKNRQADYSSFVSLDLSEYKYYSQNSFYNYLKDPERISLIFDGNYGSEEIHLLSENLSIARLYIIDSASSDFGIHIDKSIFQTDTAGFESILIQLSLLCTTQTQNAAAAIIDSCTNKAYCQAILSNIYGYDPDGKLLESIERNAELAGNKDKKYLNSICDAVYSICLFMGRPAWNLKGKNILKKFMGMGYSTETRLYARDTLKKIMALEL